jgi:hypothetical protein
MHVISEPLMDEIAVDIIRWLAKTERKEPDLIRV